MTMLTAPQDENADAPQSEVLPFLIVRIEVRSFEAVA